MKPFSKNTLIKIWPVMAILGITLLLFLRNYSPNTWLIGWDNLMPEFNLGMNIQRSIFAVWQEYQGLGLLGGMGHASDLIHQLSLLLMSLIIPMQLLRYAWTFLLLFTGSTGAYFLIKKLILKDSEFSYLKKQSIALLGGLFYLLNLSTIQSFYAPFEAFIAHFAALPWLLLASLLFFIKPNRKNGLFFVIVLILTTPQAYIPTLFLVYMISLMLLTFCLAILKPGFFVLKSFLKMLTIILIVNAFWLLPFLYFTFTNSQVALSAKINQMSTETVFLQNKEYGDIFSVMLLKGFWFSNVDPNLKAVFTYMFSPWRDYLSNFSVTALGLLLFGIVLAGIAATVRKGKDILIAFFVLFLFSFTMLAINTPPFSWADILFRQIPLFNEAFRFPFTKFSILTSLTYSIFFALGAAKIATLPVVKRVNFQFLMLIFVLLLVIFTLPIFNGKLFYEKVKINPPKEYSQVFDFFNKQDPNTRIANLPQPTFWGWEFYNWGYGGSGFLWYGIKQPMLDRAFDVWSKTDENYYWELSQAIYSKNPLSLEKVLNKYQVNWLLLDKNLIYPSSPLSLFTPEITSILKQIPSVQKAASFGNIDVYKVSLKDAPKSFLFSASNLAQSNTYQWGNFDKAYSDFGNYLSSGTSNFYPFRSLFSNKNQENLEFKMTNETNEIVLENPLPQYSSPVSIKIPSFLQNENMVATDFITEKNTDNSLTLSVVLRPPEISILDNGGKNKILLYSKNLKIPLVVIPAGYKTVLNVNVNGLKNYSLNPSLGAQDLGSTFFVLSQDNVVTYSGNALPVKTVTVKASDISSLLNSPQDTVLPNVSKGSLIQITIPKINDNYESFEQPVSQDETKRVGNCDNFNQNQVLATISELNNQNLLRLESQKATACLFFATLNPIHNQGYAMFVQSANQKGRALHFWLLNEDEKTSALDTYLPAISSLNNSAFVIAPEENFGRGYSFHFDNISILNEPTINYLGNLFFYPIPYNFITALKFSASNGNQTFQTLDLNNIQHPNEAKYILKNVRLQKTASLILSQSFDFGWKAYEIKNPNTIKEILPFLFGSEEKNHVLINNWENGWILNSTKDNFDLVIVYLPQYLEYLGFIILIMPVLVVLLRFLASKRLQKRAPMVDL